MRSKLGYLLASGCILAISQPANAQNATYNIPAGDLKVALDTYSAQSNSEIIYKVDQVRGVRSPGVRGAMSAEAALNAVLAGTGFAARRYASGAVAIAPVSADPNGEEAGRVDEVTVTGSRIRGAPPTSPVISVTQEQMRNSGLATLGDAARSLPQNFAGGQNPGVADGAAGVSNRNVSASSTINLRGIGPDATLTLLNGHRLAYDYSFQGVDISAIPLAAVDRLEIVADGASAIYGSDAVAGVANIILKRDYDGLSTTARFGASTDGGNEQQEYSVVGGQVWQSGGLMAIYNYQKNTPIISRQRSYTTSSQADQTLIPGLRQHSAILSGHQRLNESLVFSADATYNFRKSEVFGARTANLPPSQEGQELFSRVEEYAAAPSLKWEVSPRWQFELVGSYARSITHSDSRFNSGGRTTIDNPAFYDNKTKLVELSGEGSLFKLNGNDVGIAVGGGYRTNSLSQELQSIRPNVAPTASRFFGRNSSYYGFGELSLPLVTPANGSPVYRLSLTAAVRYENYSRGEEVATPKIGAVFAPVPGIEIKGSWGKSFKAPTLIQLYAIPTVDLYPSSFFGFPGTGTALFQNGANPDLKNERATTWTGTVAFKPSFVPGLRLEVSYFNIKYIDRVVSSPIDDLGGVFSNPSYASLINRQPTQDQMAAAIAVSPLGLRNRVGRPYDPAEVAVIIDGRNVNIARQDLDGVDVLAGYDIDGSSFGRISITGIASYLNSSQSLLPGQVATRLAGTVFDPPNWRFRGGVTWARDRLTLNSTVNYSGSLIDDRQGASIDVGTKTTLDLTARLNPAADSGIFSNVDVALSAINILNAKPRFVRAFSLQSRPYDSTNDSTAGRFISISVTKRW